MFTQLTPDEWFMKLAIAEAYRGKGKTLPNPAVGAVIVKEGKVVATGFHKKAGLPHAEAEALEKAKNRAKGSVLYVTLEPCNHYGRTPPCTEKIIRAGVKRVVIGTRDPNPVAKGGVEKLQKAGIEVVVGVLENDCRELIDDFVHLLHNNRPFVSLKLAATLDGNIADFKGTSKWITDEEARRYVHKFRSFHNAVMVGVGTVLKDDPLLNVRYLDTDSQPKAVVLDRDLRIPVHCRLVKERAGDLIVITAQKSLLGYKAGILKDLGVTLLPVYGKGELLDLEEGLQKLMEEYGIYSVFCEGGSKLAGNLLSEGLMDKVYLFYAPKLIGRGVPLTSLELELPQAKKLKITNIAYIGKSVLFTATPERSN